VAHLGRLLARRAGLDPQPPRGALGVRRVHRVAVGHPQDLGRDHRHVHRRQIRPRPGVADPGRGLVGGLDALGQTCLDQGAVVAVQRGQAGGGQVAQLQHDRHNVGHGVGGRAVVAQQAKGRPV
jgi:hypothetical protein